NPNTPSMLLSLAWPLLAGPAPQQAPPASPPPPVLAAASQPPAKSPDVPNDPGLDYWRDHRVGLDFHPGGYTVYSPGFRFSSLIPMHPAGFPADDYSGLTPLDTGFGYALGHGLEVQFDAVDTERIGPGGSAIFYGFGLQKQLLRESRSLPA